MFCTQVTLHPDYDAAKRRVRAWMADTTGTEPGTQPKLSVSIEEKYDEGSALITFFGSPAAVLAELDAVRDAIDKAIDRFGSPLPEPVGNAA